MNLIQPTRKWHRLRSMMRIIFPNPLLSFGDRLLPTNGDWCYQSVQFAQSYLPISSAILTASTLKYSVINVPYTCLNPLFFFVRCRKVISYVYLFCRWWRHRFLVRPGYLFRLAFTPLSFLLLLFSPDPSGELPSGFSMIYDLPTTTQMMAHISLIACRYEKQFLSIASTTISSAVNLLSVYAQLIQWFLNIIVNTSWGCFLFLAVCYWQLHLRGSDFTVSYRREPGDPSTCASLNWILGGPSLRSPVETEPGLPRDLYLCLDPEPTSLNSLRSSGLVFTLALFPNDLVTRFKFHLHHAPTFGRIMSRAYLMASVSGEHLEFSGLNRLERIDHSASP